MGKLTPAEITKASELAIQWEILTGLRIERKFVNKPDIDKIFGDQAYRWDLLFALGKISQPLYDEGIRFLEPVTQKWQQEPELPCWVIREAITTTQGEGRSLEIIADVILGPEDDSMFCTLAPVEVLANLQYYSPDHRVFASWQNTTQLVMG